MPNELLDAPKTAHSQTRAPAQGCTANPNRDFLFSVATTAVLAAVVWGVVVLL